MQTQLEQRNPTTGRRGATPVLVVDDDRDIRELLVELLESEHYEVSSACDGQHALGSLLVQWPDIILLDLMMPFLVDEVLDTVHRLAGREAPWHARHSPEEKTK